MAITRSPRSESAGMIRVGGVAAITASVLVAILNFALGEVSAPSIDAEHVEIVDWIASDRPLREAAIVIRFLAFGTAPVMAAGVAAYVRQGRDRGQRAWSVEGIVGMTWMAALGTMATVLEAVAVAQGGALADQPELTAGLWFTAHTLFARDPAVGGGVGRLQRGRPPFGGASALADLAGLRGRGDGRAFCCKRAAFSRRQRLGAGPRNRGLLGRAGMDGGGRSTHAPAGCGGCDRGAAGDCHSVAPLCAPMREVWRPDVQRKEGDRRQDRDGPR